MSSCVIFASFRTLLISPTHCVWSDLIHCVWSDLIHCVWSDMIHCVWSYLIWSDPLCLIWSDLIWCIVSDLIWSIVSDLIWFFVSDLIWSIVFDQLKYYFRSFIHVFVLWGCWSLYFWCVLEIPLLIKKEKFIHKTPEAGRLKMDSRALCLKQISKKIITNLEGN